MPTKEEKNVAALNSMPAQLAGVEKDRAEEAPAAENMGIQMATSNSQWIDAVCMREGLRPRRQDDAARRRERAAERKLLRMEKAAHVVPVALIQAIDFASDLMVVVQLAKAAGGASVDWILCVVAVGISLIVAWIVLLGQNDNTFTCREKLTGCVLACANLHVLYVGTLYISAISERRPQRKAERLYHCFIFLKMLETGIESVVLGLVTAAAFFRTLVGGGDGLALFASSLALSLLSMAYGFFGEAAGNFEEDVGRPPPRPTLFVCLLVHLCWVIAAFGALAAAAGVWWLLGIGAMWAVGGMRNFFWLKDAESLKGCKLIACSLILTSWLGLAMVPVDHDMWSARGLSAFHTLTVAAARRAVLLGVAATAVALDPSAAVAAGLASLFLLDLLCSPHLFRILGIIKWDPLGALMDRCTRHGASNAVAPAARDPPVARVENTTTQTIATGDKAALLDMLDAVDRQCAAPTGSAAAGAARPEATDELSAEAVILRREVTAGKLSSGLLVAIVATLGQYMPWEEGAQRSLLDKLRGRHTSEGQAALAQPAPPGRPRRTHPLRALPLVAGLAADIWAVKPSFFGKQPTGTHYGLSVDADHVDYFVSHAWQDDSKPKVQMLRSFLCLQALVAQATVPMLLLSAFLLPLGAGIYAWLPWFPWWAPSMLPLALLALMYLWVLLSRVGAIPRAWRPWALSPRTIWLDKCCIDQSLPEMIEAGVSSFGEFLAKCDNMVAFASPTYFSRLWCVYELATFCNMHKGHLDERLLLLSPTWPSVFNPFKTAWLTEEELVQFTGFTLAEVQCAMPRDRAIVLEEIRRKWGSEAAFETFVRTELPKVLAASKRRYSKQIARVAGRAFEIAFGG